MALDEALLEAMPRLEYPVLRFYGWSSAAASFGYFQKYSAVERFTPLRPLVRRPTGGGLVPHAADWTYSLAFPTIHAWYRLAAVESYRRLHEWIREALAACGIAAELAPEPAHDQPGQCFAGYERFDLLWKGRKIAGAAQRRRRDGLLIQGSVQPGSLEVSRTAWQKAMCGVASLGQGVRWEQFVADAALNARAVALAGEKYSQASYNQRR